jgi:hypothetical protein
VYQERLEDLSVVYWLKDKFSSSGFVTIVDAFPEDTLVLPTISVEWDTIEGYQWEIGNRKVMKERVWFVDIFAKNKSQRDEFAYKVFNDLDDGITVYNYNEGFPEQGGTPSRLGCLNILNRKVRNIEVDADLVDELYYRATVIFTAAYDQF